MLNALLIPLVFHSDLERDALTLVKEPRNRPRAAAMRRLRDNPSVARDRAVLKALRTNLRPFNIMMVLTALTKPKTKEAIALLRRYAQEKSNPGITASLVLYEAGLAPPPPLRPPHALPNPWK